MDRNEFVSTLRGMLVGKVAPSVVEDNVRYYDMYISQEVASGKSEKEVLQALGDPRLIARTIIDMQETPGEYSESYSFDSDRDEAKNRKGFHAEINEEGGIDLKYHRFNFNSWYGKLLLTIILILIVVLIFTIVGGILSWILSIAFPCLVILWMIRVLSGRR